ncbi:MAG TPA: IniB N-terminal domain-containing protein [Pseudonocardiaceae bacterium]|jgi:hypothetical protein|nr:IniB N-terminal domain-containing protein [Pseudonocardiaceae bacterium]
MESVSTLHDFVLNLLSDPTALTAFAADPQAVLTSAGLADITPAQVNNALPLVIDYAPSHLVPALEAAQSALPVDGLSDGPAGAIAHLTALTSTLSDTTTWLSVADDHSTLGLSGGVANSDLGLLAGGNASASVQNGVDGAFGVHSPLAHADWSAGTTGLAGGLNNLAAVNELSGGLDSDVINKVTGGELNAGALSGATAFATNLVANPADVLAHPTDITNALTGTIGGTSLPTNLGDPTSAVSDTLHSVLANVPDPNAIGGLTGLSGITNVTSGLTNGAGLDAHDPLSAVTSHLPAGVTDLVNGAISNATSQIPGASDALHTATSALHGATATSASPLDGVSASSVGDTVNHVTGDVTGALHGVLPDVADHGLLGL